MREASIKDPKPLVLKGVRNTQEVENFLWHLENYFKHGKVRDDEAKINTVVLYLLEVVTLWWRQKCTDMESGLCKIETWEQFTKELKKQFYLVNVVYEARRKPKELLHMATICEYVHELTTLMLQIPAFPRRIPFSTSWCGLQNWVKVEFKKTSSSQH
ncbi:uncharacterized protein [Nicotiana sylvestris]|uniref:uncharacterized protein n=1 Tax=Nicotiana sylvestris TaxID=4096 RepID=UPI00388CDEB7